MTDDRLRDALKIILERACDHPAFDAKLFDSRDLEALAEIGGDVFDWTLTAINASDALKG
jgi:hypothetical protein